MSKNLYPNKITLLDGQQIELTHMSNKGACYGYSYFVVYLAEGLYTCMERDGGKNKDNNEKNYYFNELGDEVLLEFI